MRRVCKSLSKGFFRFIHKIVKSDHELCLVCLSPWNNLAPTGQIFVMFGIWVFFKNLSGKIQVSLKSDKNNRYFMWRHTLTISCWILLRMVNFPDKSCRENQSTHFMFNNFVSKNCTIYETIWNNMVESDKPSVTIQPVCIACWVSKATGTHSECELLNRFSMAKLVTCIDTYIANLVISKSAFTLIKAGRTSPYRGNLIAVTELYHKAWCISNWELYRTDRKPFTAREKEQWPSLLEFLPHAFMSQSK